MKPPRSTAFALLLIAASAAMAQSVPYLQPATSFKSFDSEVRKTSATLGCARPKLNNTLAGAGALYSCIGGKEETIKWFINESFKRRGTVRNVKFLWNEFAKDAGYGIGPDRKAALAWAAHLADLYAPTKKPEVLKAFMGKKNLEILAPPFLLNYTFHQGPTSE